MNKILGTFLLLLLWHMHLTPATTATIHPILNAATQEDAIELIQQHGIGASAATALLQLRDAISAAENGDYEKAQLLIDIATTNSQKVTVIPGDFTTELLTSAIPEVEKLVTTKAHEEIEKTTAKKLSPTPAKLTKPFRRNKIKKEIDIPVVEMKNIENAPEALTPAQTPAKEPSEDILPTEELIITNTSQNTWDTLLSPYKKLLTDIQQLDFSRDPSIQEKIKTLEAAINNPKQIDSFIYNSALEHYYEPLFQRPKEIGADAIISPVNKKYLEYKAKVLQFYQEIVAPLANAHKKQLQAPAPKKEDVLTTLFDELVDKSNKFNQEVCPFPTKENRIAAIAKNSVEKKSIIASQANQVRPLLYKPALNLMQEFLKIKTADGSDVEKKLYQNMHINTFIDRLLTKRPLTFYGSTNSYRLRGINEKRIQNDEGEFKTIGTNSQTPPFTLDEYLSYDEMQLSALLGISSPTFFINNGNQSNFGKPSNPELYQPTGIFTGLVGAYLQEQFGFLEAQHITISATQNTTENGYGKDNTNSQKGKLLKAWATFYGLDHFPTYQEAEENKNPDYLVVPITKNKLFNMPVYKKRMLAVYLPFLVDADKRGQEAQQSVYCHIIGLGTNMRGELWGEFRLLEDQEKAIIAICEEIVKNADFTHISDIHFNEFKNIQPQPQPYQITTKGNRIIRIHFSSREPAAKLTDENKDKLLVAMYSWSSNAYVGNEYWIGALNASKGAGAACCSTITELQNPLINAAVSYKNLSTVD